MRIVEEGVLAEGGMATVALGRTDAGARVVIKRIRPALRHDRAMVRLFEDEAAVNAALQHAHIVQFLYRGDDELGPYLVFEHIDGVDVSCLISDARARGEALPLALVLAVGIGVAKALHAVHSAVDARGQPLLAVHRDVSPNNILVGVDGCPKLFDFGVAHSSLRTQATVVGELKGKFAYMAPEQTRGEPCDARTDLFALGAVLYELMTLTPAFDGPTDADVVNAVRSHEPPLPEAAAWPAALCDVVKSLLHKRNSDRPASALQVASALLAIAEEACLDDGLSRHAARAVRAVVRAPVKLEERRRTQRVVNATPPPARPPLSLLLGWVLGLSLSVTVGLVIGVAVPQRLVATAQPIWRRPAPSVVRAPVHVVEVPVRQAAVNRMALRPVVVPTRALVPPTLAARSAREASLTPRLSRQPGPKAAPAAVGFGRLSVQSEPWASVAIDGQLVETETPLLRFVLSAGRHTVTLKNPVYGLEHSFVVDIGANTDVRRFVDLHAP